MGLTFVKLKGTYGVVYQETKNNKQQQLDSPGNYQKAKTLSPSLSIGNFFLWLHNNSVDTHLIPDPT